MSMEHAAGRDESASDVVLVRPGGVRRWWGGSLRMVRSAFHFARWRWRCADFGWRSRLESPDLLTGLRHVRIGRRVEIRKGARIEAVGAATGNVISIGDGTSIHFRFHVGAARRVSIGRNVLIAGDVFVTDHDHEPPAPGRPRVSGRLRVAPTVIDDDCWLGEGARVLKGVHLGQGCVVGANAVVTRSFPPYSIVGGVPARLLRAGDAVPEPPSEDDGTCEPAR